MIIILIIITTLIAVAFLTLFERKILRYIHYRKGPNKVGYFGLIQPFRDAIKLLTKEFFYPLKSNYIYYFFSPFIIFTLIISLWLIYPFYSNTWNWELNIFYFLCIISMGVYGLIISGWSSNSSFSILGSIRSIAQSISYEVVFSITLIIPFFIIESLNFYSCFYFNFFFLTFWPSITILFFRILAEINRTPFDLSEGESELVSGFNIEYRSHGFVLIFLAEYASILLIIFLFRIINFQIFFLTIYFITIILRYFIIWIRVTLPRIRYDFLIYFCWFYLLRYTLIIFLIYLLLKLPIIFFFI